MQLVLNEDQESSGRNDSNGQKSKIDQTKPPSSPAETLRRIKDDNDRSYFLSGDVDSLIYDKE